MCGETIAYCLCFEVREVHPSSACECMFFRACACMYTHTVGQARELRERKRPTVCVYLIASVLSQAEIVFPLDSCSPLNIVLVKTNIWPNRRR